MSLLRRKRDLLSLEYLAGVVFLCRRSWLTAGR